MVRKILFIEGTTDDTNGDLRKGFRILFEKKLKKNIPKLNLVMTKNLRLENL